MPYTILYVWEDTDAPTPEQKFGDHFSRKDTLEEAFVETKKYIRNSLGRQKHKFDQGRVIIHRMWDATAYAKHHNRHGRGQKVDDLVRPVIGNHIQNDVHSIGHIELIKAVEAELDTVPDTISSELVKHLISIFPYPHDTEILVIDATTAADALFAAGYTRVQRRLSVNNPIIGTTADVVILDQQAAGKIRVVSNKEAKRYNLNGRTFLVINNDSGEVFVTHTDDKERKGVIDLCGNYSKEDHASLVALPHYRTVSFNDRVLSAQKIEEERIAAEQAANRKEVERLMAERAAAQKIEEERIAAEQKAKREREKEAASQRQVVYLVFLLVAAIVIKIWVSISYGDRPSYDYNEAREIDQERKQDQGEVKQQPLVTKPADNENKIEQMQILKAKNEITKIKKELRQLEQFSESSESNKSRLRIRLLEAQADLTRLEQYNVESKKQQLQTTATNMASAMYYAGTLTKPVTQEPVMINKAEWGLVAEAPKTESVTGLKEVNNEINLVRNTLDASWDARNLYIDMLKGINTSLKDELARRYRVFHALISQLSPDVISVWENFNKDWQYQATNHCTGGSRFRGPQSPGARDNCLSDANQELKLQESKIISCLIKINKPYALRETELTLCINDR